MELFVHALFSFFPKLQRAIIAKTNTFSYDSVVFVFAIVGANFRKRGGPLLLAISELVQYIKDSSNAFRRRRRRNAFELSLEYSTFNAPMLNLRKLLPEDLEQVLAISRVSFKKPWPKNEFEKYLNSSFVVDDSGKIAGFVVGKIKEYRGILKLIAVNPDFRGKGVGKMLMDHVFKYFAENGVKEAVAHSRLHNKAGCSFLKSFGFEIIKTIKNYYLDGEAGHKTVPGEDAYLMVKKLDG